VPVGVVVVPVDVVLVVVVPAEQTTPVVYVISVVPALILIETIGDAYGPKSHVRCSPVTSTFGSAPVQSVTVKLLIPFVQAAETEPFALGVNTQLAAELPPPPLLTVVVPTASTDVPVAIADAAKPPAATTVAMTIAIAARRRTPLIRAPSRSFSATFGISIAAVHNG